MLLIDKLSSKPVYEQIIEEIERNIMLGVYKSGEQLPSLRELSLSLGINPNTIQKSYAELTRCGIICPAPGSGCYVSANAIEMIRERARKKLDTLSELARELAVLGITEEEMREAIGLAFGASGENGEMMKGENGYDQSK